MTTLCFNSVENDPFLKKGLDIRETRIREIISQILHYGVDEAYIFTVEDIMERKRTQKVVKCLEEVKNLVSGCSSLSTWK